MEGSYPIVAAVKKQCQVETEFQWKIILAVFGCDYNFSPNSITPSHSSYISLVSGVTREQLSKSKLRNTLILIQKRYYLEIVNVLHF